MGLFGVMFGILGIVIHLCSIRSFGVPYMISYTSLKPEDIKMAFVRVPLKKLNKRREFYTGWNKYRQTRRHGGKD